MAVGLGLILSTQSVFPQAKPAREAIAAAYKVFEAAYFKGDAEAIAKQYTLDAELFLPNGPIVKGRQAIQEVWKNLVSSGGNKLRIETIEVQEAGNWAYETGKFVAMTPDGKVIADAKYLVIWKRDESGEWKTHRDIPNSNVPMKQP